MRLTTIGVAAAIALSSTLVFARGGGGGGGGSAGSSGAGSGGLPSSVLSSPTGSKMGTGSASGTGNFLRGPASSSRLPRLRRERAVPYYSPVDRYYP